MLLSQRLEDGMLPSHVYCLGCSSRLDISAPVAPLSGALHPSAHSCIPEWNRGRNPMC